MEKVRSRSGLKAKQREEDPRFSLQSNSERGRNQEGLEEVRDGAAPPGRGRATSNAMRGAC